MESLISDYTQMSLDDSETEIELCSFYEKLVKELCQQYDLNFLVIRLALKNIRSYQNRELEQHNPVSFDEAADRLSYIFAYSLVHTEAMCDRFSRMLKENPSLLDRISSMKEINLCCLGGGPGFEAVALCRIFGYVLSKSDGKRQPLHFHVTIIDICGGWEDDAKLILKSVQQNLQSTKNIEIDLTFIVADLTDDFSEEVKKAIKRSHFVTMFKFLSDVKESTYKEFEVTTLVEKTVDCMGCKGCLFYLDASGGGLFNKMDRFIDQMLYTSRIYGPCLHNCYHLPLNSVETFEDSLKHIFRYLKCTNRITISCSAWVKLRYLKKDNKSQVFLQGQCSSQTKNHEKPKIKSEKVKIKKVMQAATTRCVATYNDLLLTMND